MRRALSCAASLIALQGCTVFGGHVNVDPVAVSAQKPGNVAMYVAVSQHGAGVVGLQKDDFKVYENGVALKNDDIKLTLLSTSTTVSRRAALLVDMSKALTRDERKSLADALRPFIVRLRQREAVSLYAFDGSKGVHLIQEYAKDARAEPDEKDTSMDRLLSFSRKDASSSLYTAVIDGAKKLSASLAAEGRPIQSGTLIVVALNPDLAGRVEESDVRDYLEESPHHYFLMTVGTWAEDKNVTFLGKNGTTRAGSPMTMSAPLSDVANAIDDDYFRNYLVAYCSPSRGGNREVKLEVSSRDTQGKVSLGSYTTPLDASGFGPGCDPTTTPRFVVAKPKEPTEPKLVSNKPTKPAPASRPAAAPAAAAPAAVPVVAPAPAPISDSDKVSTTTTPAAKPSGPAPIAEPPKGLGYE